MFMIVFYLFLGTTWMTVSGQTSSCATRQKPSRAPVSFLLPGISRCEKLIGIPRNVLPCSPHKTSSLIHGVLLYFLQIPLPNSPPWFAVFRVEEYEIADICRSILRLYTRTKVLILHLGWLKERGGPFVADKFRKKISYPSIVVLFLKIICGYSILTAQCWRTRTYCQRSQEDAHRCQVEGQGCHLCQCDPEFLI